MFLEGNWHGEGRGQEGAFSFRGTPTAHSLPGNCQHSNAFGYLENGRQKSLKALHIGPRIGGLVGHVH